MVYVPHRGDLPARTGPGVPLIPDIGPSVIDASVYTDPAEELIGILLTQREMTSPGPPNVFRDFWTCAYQAIDD